MILAFALSALLAAAAPDGPPAARRADAGAIRHYLEARRAEAGGDFPRALNELEQAISADGAAPQIRVARAEILARLTRLPEAEVEARRAVALDPEGETAADAWLLLGRLAAARADVPGASRALRTAAALERRLAREREPDEIRSPDPEPWRMLARVQLASGDEAGAAATWADLAKDLPADAARGYAEMAKVFADERDAGRAERYLRTAVETFQGDADAWKKLGGLQERRRAFAEARGTWEAALRAEPDEAETLAALGRLSLRLGDVPSAQAYYRQLRHVDPDEAGAVAGAAAAFLAARRPAEALAILDEGPAEEDPRLHFVRGLALEDLRRWPEAAAAFARVGDDDPDLAGDARQNRGYALSQAGRHAEALEVLDAALAERPRDARVLATRALALERAGRAPEAVEELRRAAEEEVRSGGKSQAELYDALAQTLARAGRPAEAVSLLRGAVRARPGDEGLLFALGAAQERAGDMDGALAQMKELLALAPDNAEALNFVGYAYAERGTQLEEAERLLTRALELKPDNGYFLDSLGWVFFQKGDAARAVSTLERADAAAGPEPTILEHLGDAYRRAQRIGDAESAYRRALKSIDAGESADGPEKTAAQRAGLERKLRELSSRGVAAPAGAR